MKELGIVEKIKAAENTTLVQMLVSELQDRTKYPFISEKTTRRALRMAKRRTQELRNAKISQ